MLNTLENIQIDHWDGLKWEFILAIIFIQKTCKIKSKWIEVFWFI
jgi:hypothetical protein